MILNYSKGMAGPLASFMMMVFVALVLFNFQSIVVEEDHIVNFNMQDMYYIGQSSMYGSYMEENYIPKAMELSRYQAEYERSQEILEWEENDLNKRAELVVKEEINDDFRAYFSVFIEDANSEIPCEINVLEEGINFDFDSSTSLDSGQSNVRCESQYIDTEYNLSDISDSRTSSFFPIVETGQTAAQNAESYYDEEVEPGEDYTWVSETESEEYCEELEHESQFSIPNQFETDVDDRAERNAFDQAKEDFKGSIGEVEAVDEELEDIEVKGQSVDITGYESRVEDDYPKYDPEDGPEEVEDEETDDSEYCRTYTTRVEVKIDELEVSYKIEDDENRIPTQEGLNTLELENVYIHTFDIS